MRTRFFTGIALCATLLLLCPVPAGAAGFNPNYSADIIKEQNQTATVKVWDILNNCMDNPAPGDNFSTGSFAIRNPSDRAFIIEDIRFDVQGSTEKASEVFFTLNRFSPHCAISHDKPNEHLSLEGYMRSQGDNRSLVRRMLAGMEYIGATSVKYYSFLEVKWNQQPPKDLILNMHITLAPVGIDGVVFIDTDGDGLRSELEGGIPGALVLLLDEEGRELDRCNSDYRGYYCFPSPQPGEYFIEVRPPSGYSFALSSGPPPRRARSRLLEFELTGHLKWDAPLQSSGLERSVGLARIKRTTLLKDNFRAV